MPDGCPRDSVLWFREERRIVGSRRARGRIRQEQTWDGVVSGGSKVPLVPSPAGEGASEDEVETVMI